MRWTAGFQTKATAGFGAMLLATVVVAGVAVVEARRGAERATLPDQLHEKVWGACRRAGLRKIRWHDLRHSTPS